LQRKSELVILLIFYRQPPASRIQLATRRAKSLQGYDDNLFRSILPAKSAMKHKERKEESQKNPGGLYAS